MLNAVVANAVTTGADADAPAQGRLASTSSTVIVMSAETTILGRFAVASALTATDSTYTRAVAAPTAVLACTSAQGAAIRRTSFPAPSASAAAWQSFASASALGASETASAAPVNGNAAISPNTVHCQGASAGSARSKHAGAAQYSHVLSSLFLVPRSLAWSTRHHCRGSPVGLRQKSCAPTPSAAIPVAFGAYGCGIGACASHLWHRRPSLVNRTDSPRNALGSAGSWHWSLPASGNDAQCGKSTYPEAHEPQLAPSNPAAH